MKIYPILFSPLMVRALLDGRKTQTRRLLWSKQKSDKSDLSAQTALNQRDGKTPWAKVRPGDLLWIRETWADVNTENGPAFAYKAAGLRFCVDDAYPVDYERYPKMQFTMWPKSRVAVTRGNIG